MSQRVNTVEVKVREKSSTAGSQAFQTEVLDATSDPTRINFRFNQPLKPGRYMLVAGTRAGQGRDYRLRIVRTPINVLG